MSGDASCSGVTVSVTDVLYFGNSAALELVSVALVGPGQRLISYPLPAAAAAEPP